MLNTQKATFSPWCWPKNSSTEEDPVSRHLECLYLASRSRGLITPLTNQSILQRLLWLVKIIKLANWPITKLFRKVNCINAGSMCWTRFVFWKRFWRPNLRVSLLVIKKCLEEKVIQIAVTNVLKFSIWKLIWSCVCYRREEETIKTAQERQERNGRGMYSCPCTATLSSELV